MLMDDAQANARSSPKTWAISVFAVIFLSIWLSGMTAGLMAGACRKEIYEGEKKLRFCNISLTAAAWSKVFPIERAKGSILHLERGIALTQIGRYDEAGDAFRTAILGSRAVRGDWERDLHIRMARLKDMRALEVWVPVARSLGSAFPS